ncbi:hypothetical protein JHD50_01355 [Sulfurimonas sp. MAG313]|nr:hypothetical protein [Sulfurimonas sp. MAG313]MDF1879957.1 hypothetical protein [Sulfurimonas sp. MAG313]
MKKSLLYIFSLAFIVLFSACSDDKEDESPTTTTTTTTSTVTDLTLENATDLTFSVQKTIAAVYTTDYNLSKKLVNDLDNMKDKVESMSLAVTQSIENAEDVVSILAKTPTINAGYTSLFSVSSSYNSSTPAFAYLVSTSPKNFFLVSSKSRLFTEGNTIKTYFKNSAALLVAWKRSINNHSSGHLYFNIYELKDSGVEQRVSSSMFIPASKFPLL